MTAGAADNPMFDEVSDEMLMALADGELPPETAARLQARVAADPALAERYALYVETAAALRAALDLTDDLRAAFDPGPVPARLIETVLATPVEANPAANVVPLVSRRRPVFGAMPMALAASALIAAVGLGFLASRGMAPGPVAQDPAGQAAVVLAAVPTGGEAALPDGGTGRVLASYQTDLGLCRMIALDLAGGGSERALVCAEAAGWDVALSVNAGSDEAFLPASDTAVELMDGFLDSIAASAALSPEEEAAALRR